MLRLLTMLCKYVNFGSATFSCKAFGAVAARQSRSNQSKISQCHLFKKKIVKRSLPANSVILTETGSVGRTQRIGTVRTSRSRISHKATAVKFPKATTGIQEPHDSVFLK